MNTALDEAAVAASYSKCTLSLGKWRLQTTIQTEQMFKHAGSWLVQIQAQKQLTGKNKGGDKSSAAL